MTTKNELIWVRVSSDAKSAFIAKAERNGRTASDVLRELTLAWIDGRVTIAPHE